MRRSEFARPDPLPEGALPIPAGQALVVSGSANWQPSDRYLPPEAIAPIQVVTTQGVQVCPWFDRYRGEGVSSLLALPDGQTVVYTTGSDLVRMRLGSGEGRPLPVERLADVHELTLDGRRLLVANTGQDEALEVDLATDRVLRRLDLTPLRSPGRRLRSSAGTGIESFHLNQVFPDGDRLLGLVHHVDGFRLFSHAQRRLTGHGSGGVLDLETGWRKDLRLHAPHTVRRRGEEWLVLNSGRKELLLIDSEWEVSRRVGLRGWGRGGSLSADGRIFFAGISGIRRRYARDGDSTWTGVEAVEIETGRRWSVPLSRIEQVNSVEICPIEVAHALAALPPAPSAPGTSAPRPTAAFRAG